MRLPYRAVCNHPDAVSFQKDTQPITHLSVSDRDQLQSHLFSFSLWMGIVAIMVFVGSQGAQPRMAFTHDAQVMPTLFMQKD